MEDEQPRRLPAVEVRNKYGIRAVVLLALMIWFGYDGWFNENIQAKTFNKVGAILLGIGFIFFAVMAGSAALAVMRERKQPPPQNPPAA